MKFVSFQGSREDLGHVFWLQPTLRETNDLEGKKIFGVSAYRDLIKCLKQREKKTALYTLMVQLILEWMDIHDMIGGWSFYGSENDPSCETENQTHPGRPPSKPLTLYSKWCRDTYTQWWPYFLSLKHAEAFLLHNTTNVDLCNRDMLLIHKICMPMLCFFNGHADMQFSMLTPHWLECHLHLSHWSQMSGP